MVMPGNVYSIESFTLFLPKNIVLDLAEYYLFTNLLYFIN